MSSAKAPASPDTSTGSSFLDWPTLVSSMSARSKNSVAKVGFEAMMNGEGDVVAGWKNKIQSAAALITPSAVLAEQHRKMAEPGSANK